MKTIILFLTALLLFSCEQNRNSAPEPHGTNNLNVEAELESIEETRAGFEQAIKEKRYSDLSRYATDDMISITPICGDWEEYKKLTNDPEGPFSYDSLVMNPKETIIVSDSIAYDFGTSSVYYTNSEGNPVEITDTFLAILKKDKNDGIWKLHREVATTNTMN